MTETFGRKHAFDMVHGAQGVFRILLEVLANPGRTLNLRCYADQFAGAGQWLAPALTLLDGETGFFWDGDPQTGEEIHFLSGAPRVSPEKADIVFTGGGAYSPAEILSRVKGGTYMDPHDSALLFIAAGERGGGIRSGENITGQGSSSAGADARRRRDASPVQPAQGLQEEALLRGPGIPPEGRRVRLFPGEAAWCRAREERGFEYPRGVELIFLREDGSLMALTRKTALLWDGPLSADPVRAAGG
jgi:phosphonate C-P lyase system protein PhnH